MVVCVGFTIHTDNNIVKYLVEKRKGLQNVETLSLCVKVCADGTTLYL